MPKIYSQIKNRDYWMETIIFFAQWIKENAPQKNITHNLTVPPLHKESIKNDLDSHQNYALISIFQIVNFYHTRRDSLIIENKRSKVLLTNLWKHNEYKSFISNDLKQKRKRNWVEEWNWKEFLRFEDCGRCGNNSFIKKILFKVSNQWTCLQNYSLSLFRYFKFPTLKNLV